MVTITQTKLGPLVATFGGISHIGSASVNQDAFFIVSVDPDTLVLGVFDGHGPDVGQLAAHAAKAFFTAAFRDASTLSAFLDHPEQESRRLFHACHRQLFGRFRTFYENQGVSVREEHHEKGVYLVKRFGRTLPYTCVYGGTTATIAVIHHNRLIVANVGDSTALLARPHNETSPESNQDETNLPSHLSILTGHHAPDSKEEYERILSANPHSTLQFLYDHSTDRDQDPIHSTSTTSKLSARYVKNVRHEWATVVSAPPDAKHADSLAFTRSLGDFHLHAHGLSCEPDVTESTIEPGMCLVVASDGVWDVWQYEQVAAFFTGSSQDVEMALDSARICEFMRMNHAKAQALFNGQADNMTAVVCSFHSV
ncbi:unnamed protein product [Aphanomyces euteiches]|uniref:PPM-type phosphatase domain-containing protein n=1 Tax=Aphanomyces euteiches TaxID=100861 RepID=A0A6G0W517_9STRA|nr:hypothetical protein Ae201684_018658 [Aphanomyces euteiches]KAH9071850.1 hypothetical protein Ae201684P_020109 [Aphanomyces euteiches]KAH9134546.1 hypothetical protein AeRB84_019696 [Aphanomyces euteiches]KAH9147205.1 hypothetical protein AeRB84_009125 [Aphanomyces euteiches]